MASARTRATSPYPPSNSRATSPYPPSPRPPTFLPPSHYAAAGGFTFPPPRPPSRSSSTPTPAGYLADAYPEMAVDANMDAEITPSEKLDRRFTLRGGTRKNSEDSSSTDGTRNNGQNHRNKRESQLLGLETQLLPSLRDTIDRMTRPPPTSAPTAKLLRAPSRMGPGERSPSPARPATPQGRSTPTPSTPKSAGTEPPSTPKTPRSALKSALRTPTQTPKLFSPPVPSPSPSPTPTPSSTSTSGGGALRSVRSLLRRKSSVAKEEKPTATTSTNARPARLRSRTDPGLTLNPKITPVTAAPATPQPSRPSHNQPSHLPQLNTGSKIPRFRAGSTDDSDLDLRFEASARRKLTVANAEVFASSSSSSEESEVDIEVLGTPKSQWSRPGLAIHGLGHGAAFSPTRGGFSPTRSGFSPTASAFSPTRASGLGMNVNGLGMRWMEAKEKYEETRISYASSESDYAEDEESQSSVGGGSVDFGVDAAGIVGSGDFDPERERRRREEALVGLVGDLDQHQNALSGQDDLRMTASGSRSGSESEYCGVEGVAITMSGSVGTVESVSDYGEEEDDGHGRQREEEKDHQHHETNTSATPSVFVSGVEAEAEETTGMFGRMAASISRMAMAPASLKPSSQTSRMPKPVSRTPTASPSLRTPTSSSLRAPASPSSSSLRAPSRSSLRSPSSPSSRTPTSSPSLRPSSPSRAPSPSSLRSPSPSSRTLMSSPPARATPRARFPASTTREAAARERLAFGIPPSESDRVYLDMDERASYQSEDRSREEEQHQVLAHADSVLSDLGNGGFRFEEELSQGAEALFRTISGGGRRERTSVKTHQSRRIVLDDRPQQESRVGGIHEVEPEPEHISPPPRSPSHSPSRSPPTHAPAHSRSSVLRHIRTTEATFVARISRLVKAFVLPLRVQGGRVWIEGVPLVVARALDWVEDIGVLHGQGILGVLQKDGVEDHDQRDQRVHDHHNHDHDEEGGVVGVGVAEALRSFVPRLEIYQPYLVRLAECVEAVKGCVGDLNSDFGEFVRMQEGEFGRGRDQGRDEEVGRGNDEGGDGVAWTLERLLVEPVNRLAVYPGLFKQLLDVTPKTHPDYLATLALVRSTELMIRVMTEVKLREDEYGVMKMVERRVRSYGEGSGLGVGLGIEGVARRDRRLFRHGAVVQIQRGHKQDQDRERQDYPYEDSEPRSGRHPRDDSSSSSNSRDGHGSARNRASRLVTAINDWDSRRGRSGSTTTAGSATSSATASSWDMPPTPSPMSGTRRRDALVLGGGSRHVHDRDDTSSSHAQAQEDTSRHERETLLHLFVFSDLLLVTTPLEDPQDRDDVGWMLCRGVGVSKIVDVRMRGRGSGSGSSATLDRREQVQDDEHPPMLELELDLLPLELKNINDKSLDCVRLGLETITIRLERDLQSWMDAFERSARATKAVLGMPLGLGGGGDDEEYLCRQDRGRDQSQDARRRGRDPSRQNLNLEWNLTSRDRERDLGQVYVDELVGCGLPIPRSPSFQVEGSDQRQEREERGWWGVRFREVLREVVHGGGAGM